MEYYEVGIQVVTDTFDIHVYRLDSGVSANGSATPLLEEAPQGCLCGISSPPRNQGLLSALALLLG